MRFENKKFEAGVKETLKSIEELNESIEEAGKADSFDDNTK